MEERVALVGLFDNRLDAEIAMDILEDQNIPSYVIAGDTGGTDPALELANSVRLLVRRADLARARQALKEEWGE